jgi:ABC-2 type transport system permease protein
VRTELRRIWLLARREYLQRVRSKSFVVTTAIIPLFMFLVGVVPSKLATMRRSGTVSILVASDDPKLADEFKRQLDRRSKSGGSTYQVEMRPVEGSDSAAERQKLEAEAQHGNYEGMLWLTTDAVNRQQVSFATRSATDFMLIGSLRSAVVLAAARYRLAQRGVKDDSFEDILRMDLQTSSLEREGTAGGGEGAFLTGLFLVLILYMSVLVNGMTVMRSVLEEKTSRVMEVMLALVTPRELMAGKIIGVAAVGLTQIAVWVILASLLGAPGLAAMGGAGAHFPLSLPMVLYFALFFLLGYLLYSAMYAAVGAAMPSEDEAQQWHLIVAMPIIVAIAIVFLIYREPSSTLSVVLSIIPFFAPILMFLRTVLQQPPLWQMALCIGLLVATIFLMLQACARIYRVGILMYGKRPTLPELMKWAKEA